ncbi:hypothetical protein [Homoserinimonas hongtaonis]|uniref:Uncharacterized protein n=1 Tax=Homoserinimonas hongtaonis TaxID=2079791 RepID=A0A2U1T282_9MICO|nr:hypothetical protein [Salinibacterium hongtaonis]PWB97975.1 hypothetical protein DF220_09155 [Salinibacterium hongtaonis]
MSELGNDLAAVWPAAGGDIAGWMTRPSILRRVASEFAARLASDTDRIVALGPGASILGGAVSLVTGLPFCAAEADGALFGSLHDGERAVVISIDGESDEPAWLATLEVSRRLSVVPGGRDRSEALIAQLPLRRDSAAAHNEGEHS